MGKSRLPPVQSETEQGERLQTEVGLRPETKKGRGLSPTTKLTHRRLVQKPYPCLVEQASGL